MIDSMRNVKAPLLIFGIYFYTVKLTGEGITEIGLVLDSHLVCPYFSNALTLGSLLYILIMSTKKKKGSLCLRDILHLHKALGETSH
jgi:hypothetical protein